MPRVADIHAWKSWELAEHTAESELSVLTCRCVDHSIADNQTLAKEVSAWQATSYGSTTPRLIGTSLPLMLGSRQSAFIPHSACLGVLGMSRVR